MLREVSDTRRFITSIAFLAAFFGTTVLRFYPSWFDQPVAKVLNNFAVGHRFATDMAHGTAYPTLQGMIVLSLLWYCWFSDPGPELRARLVGCAGAAVIAGLIAHLLRYTISPTFRPIFDPLLQLHSPGVLGDIDALRANFNLPAFPSERATMFAGLAMAIFLVRRDVGLLALGNTNTKIPYLNDKVFLIFFGIHHYCFCSRRIFYGV